MIARHVKIKMNRKIKKDLENNLWRLTGAYNWALKTIESRKNAGLPYSEFDILNLLSNHSKKSGISSRALAGTVHQAFGAWQKCWSRQNGKPKLKGNRNKLNSIMFRGDCRIFPETNQIKLPNLGKLRFLALSKGFPSGKLAAQVTLIKKASGWYAVLLFDAKHEQVILASNSKIGIDTGFKNLIITSEGKKFEHPRELEKSAEQLAKAQRGGGLKKAARTQEKIANQRKDRNHKISHALVRDHNVIFITKDNLKGQATLFGKSIQSSGIGQLRSFIFYKGSSCGRKVTFVDSKYTTSTCSDCKALSGPSGLSGLNIRNWECLACGAKHDRDVNAAINVLNSGQRYCLEASKNAVLEPLAPKRLKRFDLKIKSCPGRAAS